jgi:DUF2889 family protein
MHLDVGGHPLHSRALSVTLAARADGQLDVHGVVLDLRKRGELQPSGIVHHMTLDGVVDPTARRLDSIVAAQPSIAFEASAVTAGESCRDLGWRVGQLAGATFDDRWAQRLSAEIGGPRGCSHLLTLAQLLGSTVAWALDHVIVDGHEQRGGGLTLALQLTDLHHAPAPPVAPSMARFASELEIRAKAEIDFSRFAIAALEIGQRRRERATLETAEWLDRADVAQGLVGQSVARGVSQALFERLGDQPQDRPLLDAMLMLAPALIQCVAALSDSWPALAANNQWVIGMGGRPDSCYMWRAGGALQRARGGNEPPTA